MGIPIFASTAQKLNACPICNEVITGWNGLKPMLPSESSQAAKHFVFSLTYAFEPAPLTGALLNLKPPSQLRPAVEHDPIDSDDEPIGLITWVSGEVRR